MGEPRALELGCLTFFSNKQFVTLIFLLIFLKLFVYFIIFDCGSSPCNRFCPSPPGQKVRHPSSRAGLKLVLAWGPHAANFKGGVAGCIESYSEFLKGYF